MDVRNIRADGEMHGDGNFRSIRGGENALVEMLRVDICARQELSGSFAEADTSAFREGRHFVERAAGFLGHAEFAVAENGVDIFGSAADHGDFEIVDERGAVHGDSADEAAAKKINQQRAEADFDDVAAHAPENRAGLRARVEDGAGDEAKVFGGENARQRVEKLREGCALAMRLGELADLDFAGARREWIGVQAVKVERLSFVDAWRFARQDLGLPFGAISRDATIDCNGLGNRAQVQHPQLEGSSIRGIFRNLRAATVRLLVHPKENPDSAEVQNS